MFLGSLSCKQYGPGSVYLGFILFLPMKKSSLQCTRIYVADIKGQLHFTGLCLKLVPTFYKLEDLKVLRRSPDLLNNVKIGQLQLIMEQILFYYIWGLQTFWSSDLNNLMYNPSNSPVISEKQNDV